MTRGEKWIVGVLSLVLVPLFASYLSLPHTAKAQGTNPLQIVVTGTHTSCTVTVSTTAYCFATDGLWQSLNGAAYTQLGVGVAGPAGPAGPAVGSALLCRCARLPGARLPAAARSPTSASDDRQRREPGVDR